MPFPWCGRALIAKHQLSEEKGRLVANEEHYADLKKHKRRVSTPQMEQQFLDRFPGHKDFLNELKRALRSIAPIHLREILALSRRYRRDELEAAFDRAMADGTATAGWPRSF